MAELTPNRVPTDEPRGRAAKCRITLLTLVIAALIGLLFFVWLFSCEPEEAETPPPPPDTVAPAVNTTTGTTTTTPSISTPGSAAVPGAH